MGIFGDKTPKIIVATKQKISSKNISNKEQIENEKEIIPEIKEKDGELYINGYSSSSSEEKSEKNSDFEENENNISKENAEDSNFLKLEKQFSLNFNSEKKGFKIYDLCELSGKRIAVLDKRRLEVRIFSLKTGHIINKINKEGIEKIIELKNKDLVLNSDREIYFYKLLPNKNYELYQTINEFNQGTNIMKKRFYNSKDAKEYYNLNSIYELMNGDLVSCNSYGIKIYKKEKNGKYKLSFMKQFGEEVMNVIEIKSNILIIFHQFCNHISLTKIDYIFKIYKFEIETQKLTILKEDSMDDRDFGYGVPYISYLHYNNKYLFIRYGLSLDVYDITKDMELVNKNQYNFSGIGRSSYKFKFPIHEFKFNYNDEVFVAEDDELNIKLFQYEKDFYKSNEIFPFINDEIKGIIKLKNNDFIIYKKKEIILLKNLK